MFSNFYEQASSDRSAAAATTSQSSAAKKSRKRRRRKKGDNPAEQSSTFSGTNKSVAKREMRSGAVPSRQSKRSKRQHKGPPSEAALALSAKLKEYSTQKRLDDALELYWHESNDSIRDEHHACIMIDCAARCGNIAEGEKIMNEMKNSGMHVNVQAQTALLKGYAHAGLLRKGQELFRDMCHAKDKRNRPNVRTLNTLLRGCLWTATTGSDDLAGGIATSEASWNLFRRCVSVDDLDCSSYEYFIALLCYALRVEEANSVIDEMKSKYNLTADKALSEADPSTVESLAVSLLALARALTLMNLYDEGAAMARRALHTADAAKQSFRGTTNESSKQRAGSAGGKRGWKNEDGNGSATRRAVSNSLFRSHRLSEVQLEASDLLSICSLRPKDATLTNLAFNLVTRLLYFSGGGTTELQASQEGLHESVAGSSDNASLVQYQLMSSLWHSFGLGAVIKRVVPECVQVTDIRVFGERELLLVRKSVGLMPDASVVAHGGFIDFREVFRIHDESSDRNTRTRSLDIELGSGFGDWIVQQAISNPERDYVAVELRADRVAQTFSKSVLNGSNSPLTNLCCVGSDCGSFLSRRVRDESVATIFVNHPEPPTQTFGANNQILADIGKGGTEPAHMLSSDTLVSASKCLQPNGRLVIITDNRWYARLICVTLVKSMKTCAGLISTSELSRRPSIQQVDAFGDASERVVLYEGQPSEAIGHSVTSGKKSGSSYFDRLWRSGAGTHAERRKRFIIVMERVNGRAASLSIASPRVVGDGSRRVGKKGKGGKPGKKNRKKSEAKQRRRNERRLAKRAEGKHAAVPS